MNIIKLAIPHDSDKNILGKRIKAIRTELSLTGEEFGKKLGVTKVAVSNWENGNRTPDAPTLSAIAKLGNVTSDWLLGLTNCRESIINKYNIDGDDIIIEASKDVYPEGLTKEQVIEKLKIIKKMEDIGMSFKEDGK